jgi:hypothetical protein
MPDWATIASVATAGGTLVLAVATFGSVRSANRSTRLSELAFQEQLRPMLVHSHMDDPLQSIRFGDGHRVQAEGGGAVVEEADGNLYFAVSLRNVGAGIGVIQAWCPSPEERRGVEHALLDDFRAQGRDFYIPPGGIGLWQGALRDPSEEAYTPMVVGCRQRRPFNLELLYTDSTAAQRTISRFVVTPRDDSDRWTAEVVRNWHLDRPGPR